MFLSEVFRPILLKHRCHVKFHEVHHDKDVFECFQVFVVLGRDHDVMKFGSENVVRHIGQLMHQLEFPDHIPG